MKSKRKLCCIHLIAFLLLAVCLVSFGGKQTTSAASTYVVIFEPYGGKMDVQYIPNVQHNSTISLPTPVKDGFIFRGWYQDTALTIPFTATTKVTDNLTLYAKWEQKYVVSLTVTFQHDTAIIDTHITKDDLVVVAKYMDNTTEVVKDYELSESLVQYKGENYFYVTYRDATATFKVYGVAEPRYTVYFDTQGGNTIKPITDLRPDSIITLPVEPIRDGYEFKGWYTSTAYTKKYDIYTKINSNIILYAKWEKEEDETTFVDYKLNTSLINVDLHETKPLYIPSLDPYIEVTYRSSNSMIASVSDAGVVSGNKSGRVKIYVTAPDGKILVCKVGVGTKQYAKKLSIPSSKRVKKGKTYQIKPTITPSGISKKILKYSSSKSSVASVSSSGKVKAKKKGTCYITVKTTDGTNLKKKMKIVVY